MPAEFLTDAEVALRLRWSKATLRKKVAGGIFEEGVHFHKPDGCARRWEWEAVVAWLRGSTPRVEAAPAIRLASAGGRELI